MYCERPHEDLLYIFCRHEKGNRGTLTECLLDIYLNRTRETLGLCIVWEKKYYIYCQNIAASEASRLREAPSECEARAGERFSASQKPPPGW